MNFLFVTIVLASLFTLIIKNPSVIYIAFSNASNSAFDLTVKLICIYSIWLAINNLLTQSKLSQKISKFLRKPISKLFKTNNENEISKLSLSLSSNMLGLGGIATPVSIDAMELLDKSHNEYAKTMLFVISATSIQLFPTTVMQLLTEHGIQNPTVIFLPTLFSTLISTAVGILMVKIFK